MSPSTISSAPSTASSFMSGTSPTPTVDTSHFSASLSLGGAAASLSPIIVDERSKGSLYSETTSGSEERVKMKLPPPRSGAQLSLGMSRLASRSSSTSSPSSTSFTFDASLARERGAVLWHHLVQAAENWPALASSAQEQGVLRFTPSTPTHWFLAQLTIAEFLLLYSLGSFDASNLPPFPVPAFAHGEDLGPSAVQDIGRGIPSSTQYGSTMLDTAAGRIVDAFMETRAAYQKHAVSRAGRFAAAMSGTNSEAGSSFGQAFSTAVSDDAEDTESAVDALEDAAVGSVVEAHVAVIHYFSSFAETRLPAPYPIFERQRIAAMHLNRPLSLLYRREAQGSPAALEPPHKDTIDIDGLVDLLATHASSILVQLESALPRDMDAYVAVIDERWVVPIARGKRPSGLARKVRPRWFSPEAHALLNRNRGVLILDTSTDVRFSPGDEMQGAACFAAQPILAPNGMPVAMLCVTAPQTRKRIADPAKAKKVAASEPVWLTSHAAALQASATQFMALLEHAAQSAVAQRKRQMVTQHNLLKSEVMRLGLTEDGTGGLGFEGRSPVRPQEGIFGMGGPTSGGRLVQGLDEEVEESLEKEQLLAVFQERMERARSKRMEEKTDVPTQLLPKLTSLLCTTAAQALGADLVYLARKPVKWHAPSGPERWTIVAHSSTLPPSPYIDPDQLTACPLAPAAHNVSDHCGLPALFYNLHPVHTPASTLPWETPSPTFRSGAIISAGALLLPCEGEGEEGLAPPKRSDWKREERSGFLLTILFSDRTRILSQAEQGFVAALAASSTVWLRQAGALDTYARSLRSGQSEAGSSSSGAPGPARNASRTKYRPPRDPARKESRLPLPHPAVTNTLGEDPSLALSAAASIFSPASARARKEDAELGKAAAEMMQSAYRRQRLSSPDSFNR